MTFNKEEKKLLLELVCNEQIHMLLKCPEKYQSSKYVELENLKAKINGFNSSGHPSYLDYKCMDDGK